MDSESSPPAIATGRRHMAQRSSNPSACSTPRSDKTAISDSEIDGWCRLASKTLMICPSTSTAYGIWTAGLHRTQRLHEAAVNGVVHQVLDQAVRKFHAVGEFRHDLARFEVHELQHEIEQIAVRDAGLRHRARHGRRIGDHGAELFFRDP